MRELVLDTPRGRFGGLRSDAPGAPRVLALHGWLDNAASFVPMLPHLDGLDLVALDLAGHGYSGHRPPGTDYSLIDYLADIDAVLDALGWPQASLLGHSLGGAVATVYAAAAPERVGRLALIEALGPIAGAPGSALPRIREALAQRRGVVGGRLRVFPDRMTAVRARMQANGLSEPAARLLVERGVAPVEGGFTWRSDPRLRLTSPVRADEASVREWIAGIECPVLLVAAAEAPPYFTRTCARAGSQPCAKGAWRCFLVATTCTWKAQVRWRRCLRPSCAETRVDAVRPGARAAPGPEDPQVVRSRLPRFAFKAMPSARR